jgi:hypothetical protein
MRQLTRFLGHLFWGLGGLAVMLVVLFAIIHVLRTNSFTNSNVVGQAAGWVGSHASNY